jgi:octaprenyl-diphosphate synthase
MIQTQRRFDLNLTVQDYLRIVEMKTGSLFSAAAELAALISEAEPNVIERFKNFGVQIGTAYQIYDDCVDLAGSESATGKTLGDRPPQRQVHIASFDFPALGIGV